MRHPRKLEKAGTQSPLEPRAWPAALENGHAGSGPQVSRLLRGETSWKQRPSALPGAEGFLRTRDKLVGLPRLWARPPALPTSPHCPPSSSGLRPARILCFSRGSAGPKYEGMPALAWLVPQVLSIAGAHGTPCPTHHPAPP